WVSKKFLTGRSGSELTKRSTEMATKHRRLRSYPQAGVRASSMPTLHESKMYKFGLLGLLGIALFWNGFQIFT
ncbi:hypothetical protein, partial [Nitrosospira sp. Nsp1]|uniref:hypothetical protein n=1 Tax=Nitrosospira sp. Nsp1 TaxID=136547 RepID=UPI001C409C01